MAMSRKSYTGRGKVQVMVSGPNNLTGILTLTPKKDGTKSGKAGYQATGKVTSVIDGQVVTEQVNGSFTAVGSDKWAE